jgi:hypothetical protein
MCAPCACAQVIVHGINAVLRPDFAKKASKAPAAAAVASSAGRALLQGWRTGGSGGLISAGLTTTQSSIRAAVEGRTDVSDAAMLGNAASRAAGSRCWNCMRDVWRASSSP